LHKLVCNTSPLQYLHQIGCLEIVKQLAAEVLVPPAVVEELSVGHNHGLDLPDVEGLTWIQVREPASAPALPIATDLGRGESQVLALVLEHPGFVAVLDDAHARSVAEALHLPLTGTLGLLLAAKTRGLIPSVSKALDALDAHRFRVSPATREAVLRLAGEAT